MRELITLLVILIALIVFACNKTPSPNTISKAETDSLIAEVESRLEKKRHLIKLSSNLKNSRIGRSIDKYKPIIKKYSKRYGFDWRLIVAQIAQESSFKEMARSRVGAKGLMQLMPYTAKEISRELDIQYIMKNPRENITAGIYHLNKQMRYFPESKPIDRTRLALASYNAGPGRVFDAQKIASYYKKPANKWPAVRPYLTMLKKADWELHLQVWPSGQPKYGYFYGSDETTNYVDRIWEMYMVYKEIL
jgi:membrane-bound lytic murein transglycosylase F